MGLWRRSVAWLREDPVEVRQESYPLRLDDGTFAEWMGWGSTYAGVPVSAQGSLGLTSVYRAVSLISGTIATLPLKTYRDLPDGTRERVDGSFLERPGGPGGLTQFEWTELVLVHLLLWGNAYLLHLTGSGNQIAGLIPLHPTAVDVKQPRTKAEAERFFPWTKYFTVRMVDGSEQDLNPSQLTHITAMSTDGVYGLSPVSTNRQAIATGMAGDQAAARMFGHGMMPSGLVTTEEDVDAEEAQAIRDGLNTKLAGPANAGQWAFVNRNLKFQPWTMPASDLQHIESRVHQVEEVGRIFGVPPHLLGQTEKQTSWGTGVSEQNRGLARHTLMPWTSRIEQRLTRLLPNKQLCEYDYAGLLQGSAQEELEMLVKQLDAGILTVEEVRRIRNLPPLPQPPSSSEVASDGAGAVNEEAVDG